MELSDLDNEVLVKLVGGDLVQTFVAHDVIGRLMIQCARQPGLAQVNFHYFQLQHLLSASSRFFLYWISFPAMNYHVMQIRSIIRFI